MASMKKFDDVDDCVNEPFKWISHDQINWLFIIVIMIL